ncbi:MAG: hypothetical protein CBD51_000480 [Flavobacteriales bacterium TMED191]|nr:MAG: hypothetical protein CBD51_000480 [Flavobacteriales bacterium TMED191]|tara:strand:- start:52 stop:780 length:729 start_codon:yes stop_codon:yes gene_type:complete
MNISKILFSGEQSYILNKTFVKDFGLDTTIVLYELQQTDNKKSVKVIQKEYYLNQLKEISDNTTISIKKIKIAINKLYRLKFIDVIIKKETQEMVYVKILHNNIANIIFDNFSRKTNKQIKQKTNNLTKSKKKFIKPTKILIKNYFSELGDNNNNCEMFYDYYESNGWKVGRNSMKCWKSAARNWHKRSQKNKISFPAYYDKNLENSLRNDQLTLSQYHLHLQKNGWTKSYSPTAGTTWKKK